MKRKINRANSSRINTMRKKTVRMVLSWLVLMSTSLGLPSEHVCKERWLGGGSIPGVILLRN